MIVCILNWLAGGIDMQYAFTEYTQVRMVYFWVDVHICEHRS